MEYRLYIITASFHRYACGVRHNEYGERDIGNTNLTNAPE